jgi:hypothetical protein
MTTIAIKPIMLACQNNDLDALKALLAKGVK